MAKVKVRRASREELPGLAVLRDSIKSEMPAYPFWNAVLDLDMEVDPVLEHLITHDPDGCMTAVLKDETLGFAASHVRSRQCVISEIWVLPQHRGIGAGEALISRALAYGDRSGAREFMAVVPPDGPVQGILLRHGFEPILPIYNFRLTAEQVAELGAGLSRLLPGQDVTTDLLAHKGQADIDRIDKLTRNVSRDADHLFWLKGCDRRAAFVRQGSRIGAFAYAGSDFIGPVAGSTQDAALAGIGWALELSARYGRPQPLELRVPSRFNSAIEAVQEVGGKIVSTHMVYGRGVRSKFDRYIFGSPALP